MENVKRKIEKTFSLLILLIGIIFMQSANAFEDCIITTNGKLTNIKIEHNDVIDVYPLVTKSNEKNTLFVQPLKVGETKFTVIKNNKDKYLFDVKVTEAKTEINEIQGFDILTVDCPPNLYEYYFDLDEPPEVNNTSDIKKLEEAKEYQDFIDNLEAPPELRGID